MYKNVNGKLIEMTEAEIAEEKQKIQLAKAEEKSRHLTTEEVTVLIIKQQINTLSVDDNTALRMREFYPEWNGLIGKTVDSGFRFRHDGKLYKVIPNRHTFQADWVPGGGTESIYTRIDEEHAGTLADPIPYDGNMALESGKYYIQDYVIYRCTRDTVNPVYNPLVELVGLYVETV